MGAGLGRVFDMASICVLVRHPQPHSDLRSDTLKGFADELLASYHTSRSSAALEKAIAVYEEILRMRPAGHVRRAESLNDLGDSLFHLCSYHQADETRGTRCIELLREGLRLRPPGNPLRDQSLHNLARSLRHIRYDQLGSLNTLLECASLNREALRLRSSGHPQRDKSLNNLAIDLARIVTHTGDVNMMTEMIDMRREVVRMRPLGHPLRYSSLENLGTALYISFEITGSSKLLAEAIAVLHEAVDLCPCEHHGRYLALDELSNALYIRSVYEGNFDSLAEVVNLKRQALQLLHHPHPDRARVLGNLGESLLARFHVSKDEDTLAEAITLFREVMAMESPETRTNLIALNNLAEALEAKFDQADDIEALSEAVTRHREALHMKPIGHQERFVSLEGLAQVLSKSRPCSWPEALSCYQEALQLCPVGHPARSRLLSGMSKCFLDPESTLFSLSEGISCLSGAYADTFSHVNGRLKRAVSDLNQLEAAYLASKKVGHTGVSSHDDERVMDLYAQIIGLLPLAANFDLDHSARLQAVAGRDEIARNAAARALLLGCLPRAVEMLEQGRGVFWTQTLHFRTSTFDGVPREDCMELQRMLGLLEHGAHRVENLDQPANKREQELETRRQLNEAVQALITKIRSYPGLNRFLLPPAFDVLFGSLPDGFVVIVNASKLAPHALLLHQATRLATSLVLKPFRASLYSAELRTQLPRHPVSVSENNGENWTRAMRLDGGRTGCLEDVLSYLWTSTVQPILDMLGLNKSQGRARPRLWWCVTGELAFLPIHAAGKPGHAGELCTADYVVSSYIPTLASLTKARNSWMPIACSDLTGLIICESSTAEGSAAYLSDVVNEAVGVRECFESAGAHVLNESRVHTSVSELRSVLEGKPAHVLHMACHGVQDSDPLKSAFLLQDGRISIEDIIQLDLPHTFLAFLSACHTAKGDHKLPDQAVHLAASLLFCGLRSVVGTMWSMCDKDGPKVARQFYTSLFERDQVDLDDIAYALDEAVQALRRSGIPASRWASFMHIGG